MRGNIDRSGVQAFLDARGAQRSPDLHEVTRVLGADEVVRRIGAVAG